MSIQTREKEEMLATDLQLVSLIKSNPDILLRHPELITELEVPHASGGAISLVERQVSGLRENVKKTENRLREFMDIAKDNDRLAQSRHRLSLNLLNARDLDDVISTISDELWVELNAEFVNIKLFTNNENLIKDNPELYVSRADESVVCFSTMLKHQNPMCGQSSDEQKELLFGEDATNVKSAAVIPLSAGAELGLLGLGSDDKNRFNISMGTEFLVQIGELISASLAVHLEEY